MPLVIKFRKESGPPPAVMVELAGSLDTATAPELERQLGPILGGETNHVVFDLAQLNFISSAGLRIFEIARKALKQRGGQASFVNLQPQIREVFSIIEALPGFKVFQDVAEMDEYLAARQRSHTDKS